MKFTQQDKNEYIGYLNSEIAKEKRRILVEPREQLISNHYLSNLHRELSSF